MITKDVVWYEYRPRHLIIISIYIFFIELQIGLEMTFWLEYFKCI